MLHFYLVLNNLIYIRFSIIMEISKMSNELTQFNYEFYLTIKRKQLRFCLKYSLIRGEYIYLQFKAISCLN